MPIDIPRDDEESDKDMQGLVDSSSDDDDAHAQPDEREETVQIGTPSLLNSPHLRKPSRPLRSDLASATCRIRHWLDQTRRHTC